MLEAPEVDMGHRRNRLVAVGERESRARHGLFAPERLYKALYKSGLAGPERADEQDDVAFAEQRRHSRADRPRPSRARAFDFAHANNRLARTKSARISATITAPPRSA